ncbi:excision repair cross-complementing rodent repair deficiency, complementation group 3, partial [Reticulomyxa filosa]
ILKPDHEKRPLWVCSDGHIFSETFSPLWQPAYDFLVAIAEPVCRPHLIHEYKITSYSLYAASSVGLRTSDLISGLERLSKNELDIGLKKFIEEQTQRCGKLRLVLKKGRYFLESIHAKILEKILEDEVVYEAMIKSPDMKTDERGLIVEKISREEVEIAGLEKKQNGCYAAMGIGRGPGGGGGGDIEDRGLTEEVVSFEISQSKIEQVRERCNKELKYPCVEEYDFRGDKHLPNLKMTLKPIAKHRPYQEKSLSKMFGNGRARSGLIVLPCGAGKTLVGITAVATVKKSCIIFGNTTVSVHQWCMQIQHWANIPATQVVEFSSQCKKTLPDNNVPCILVTTYHMLAHSGRRSLAAQKVVDSIRAREWGLVVLDEVHVTPARMFRQVTTMIHSKCKIGLTATLLREDDKIEDLYYLIGPKLYEANWLDLQNHGYLATVQCVEVWCPMTPDFYRAYLEIKYGANKNNNSSQSSLSLSTFSSSSSSSSSLSALTVTARKAQLLSDFNPNKFRAMEHLIQIHEKRGDKVLVFSDNIELLKHCAITLGKPFIYGETKDTERKFWLHNFNHTSHVKCLFISSVGDTSLDLPDVNVVIQISSHYGSRRQEAQRLGRILRPKPRQGDEFNAFFYSLVSKDTEDMHYATKRQRFLVDQGYSFHVLTDLVSQHTPGLHYSTPDSQRQLLLKILTLLKDTKKLSQLVEQATVEKDENGKAISTVATSKSMFARSTGNISMLTGDVGLYDEFKVENGDEGVHKKPTKRKLPKNAFLEKEQKRRRTLSDRMQKYLPK